MPRQFVEWGEQLEALHPDWDHLLWTDDNLPKLYNSSLFQRARQIVRPERVGQFRSDLARYEILAECGGVYMDCDFEPRKPLDPLLSDVIEPGCFLAWEVPNRWLNNAVMGAAVEHPFMVELVQSLGGSVRRNPAPAPPNRVSGPQYVTRVYREHGEGVSALDRDLFYPYGWHELELSDGEFPDAYAVHHWANKRREAGVPVG